MFKILFTCLLCCQLNYYYTQDIPITLKTADGDINGSLLIPTVNQKIPLVLIIAGSGPTDRNGNSGESENNSLKYLAEELYKNNIASVRFDKRSVGSSASTDEADLRFETYINDVKNWVVMLSQDVRFSKLIIAGHSEGSLLGIIASQNNKKVRGFISIAGAGRSIDVVLKEQFANVHESAKSIIFSMIDKLKKGDTLTDVPVIFYSLFRPSLQKYMMSFFKYDPSKEIKKLTIPSLIIQGDKDIQVKIIDAELLSKAQPKAQLKIISNMNHVLKECDTLEKDKQIPIYSDPNIPLKKELVSVITAFVLQI